VMDLALDGSHDPLELNTLLNNTVGINATGLFAGFDLEVLSDS
jgi:ribose 5-phosphate isomerase